MKNSTCRTSTAASKPWGGILNCWDSKARGLVPDISGQLCEESVAQSCFSNSAAFWHGVEEPPRSIGALISCRRQSLIVGKDLIGDASRACLWSQRRID